ncbi:precorrin-6A/cobalt-precorrin-6A reductase [Salmonella enterica subsp. enterica serovar Cerro]|nr:hypothetical protein [Salmonella enterica subsp. enterica serovar Cerro]EEG8977291.1 hypothetical protein [Salmonella enterica subsp. enterica serovar Cerro]
MNEGEVLVVGGTSDARALCRQLDAANVAYTLSVATPAGKALAGDIKGQVRCGRLEYGQMVAWLKENRTRWVIDASHPYAEMVSHNLLRACETAGVLLSRYQRPEQLSNLTHPLLYTARSIADACEIARRFGPRVLLTTGSKDLAVWRAGLAEKTLLAASCPDRDLFRAFTSGMIIRKLRQRDGIDIDTPLQALQKLAAQGYQDVAIQSLHIINGDEYEKIVREVQLLRPLFTRLTLGVPLLSSHNDYVQLMQALRQQMPSLRQTEKVVFMGHGASHHAFAAYACLDHMMTAQRFPARVGAVESYPEVDILIDSLRDEGVTGVHLMPLMLVAGDHAINDMASDDGDSWKMRFNAAGIPATPWLSGLGENPAIRAMFVAHLHQALNMAVEEAA